MQRRFLISIADSFPWPCSHLMSTTCTILHNNLVVQPHGAHQRALHVYKYTQPNPEPDPATKLLLFHCTQGKKGTARKPFTAKFRISATKQRRVRKGSGGPAGHVFLLHLESVVHMYTRRTRLHFLSTYSSNTTARQFSAHAADRK